MAEKLQAGINLRIKIVLVLFAIWLAAILVMLFRIGVIQRDRYQDPGNSIAVRQFFIHPMRGTILDKNQTPLAWSTVYYDLTMDYSSCTPETRQKIFDRLITVIPEFSTTCTNDGDEGIVPVYQDLTPEQLTQLIPLVEEFPVLAVRPRVDRAVYDDPAVRKLLGTVANNENCLTGISGLEKKYDKVLTGTAEIFEIIVDRFGKPILSTRKILQYPVPGKDVILQFTVDDIIKANMPDTATEADKK